MWGKQQQAHGRAAPTMPAILLILLISPTALLSLKYLGFERVLMTERVLKISSLLFHRKELISWPTVDPRPHLNIKFNIPADTGINQILYRLSMNLLLKGPPEQTATHLWGKWIMAETPFLEPSLNAQLGFYHSLDPFKSQIPAFYSWNQPSPSIVLTPRDSGMPVLSHWFLPCTVLRDKRGVKAVYKVTRRCTDLGKVHRQG